MGGGEMLLQPCAICSVDKPKRLVHHWEQKIHLFRWCGQFFLLSLDNASDFAWWSTLVRLFFLQYLNAENFLAILAGEDMTGWGSGKSLKR